MKCGSWEVFNPGFTKFIFVFNIEKLFKEPKNLIFARVITFLNYIQLYCACKIKLLITQIESFSTLNSLQYRKKNRNTKIQKYSIDLKTKL